jgi:hypothetical protein
MSSVSSESGDLNPIEKALRADAKRDKKLAENKNEYFKQVAINQ